MAQTFHSADHDELSSVSSFSRDDNFLNDYCVDLASERSFSTLKLVKSYLHSTMGEQKVGFHIN